MNNEIEIKAKNLEEALKQACIELKTVKDNIEYTIIEESNKTLFSILAPKYVIIKAKIIDEKNIVEVAEPKQDKIVKEYIPLEEEEKIKIKQIIEQFLNEFFSKNKMNFSYIIIFDENNVIKIVFEGEDVSILIGYRGEVLDSLQQILNVIISNAIEKDVKIYANAGGYREKREKILIDLANKIASNVIRTGKNITLEPMMAYERKIIHEVLQQNNKVETMSVGSEPYRKIVVKLKK